MDFIYCSFSAYGDPLWLRCPEIDDYSRTTLRSSPRTSYSAKATKGPYPWSVYERDLPRLGERKFILCQCKWNGEICRKAFDEFHTYEKSKYQKCNVSVSSTMHYKWAFMWPCWLKLHSNLDSWQQAAKKRYCTDNIKVKKMTGKVQFHKTGT